MQETSFSIFCPKGNPSQKLCGSRLCLHLAPICQQKLCQYCKHHSDCYIQINLSRIQNAFNEKNTLFMKEVDTIILANIDKMIENLEVLKKEYNQVGKESFESKWKNKELYKLLKNGKTQLLKPSTVFNFVQEINQKQKNQKEGQLQDKDITRLRMIVKDMLESHQKAISLIKYFWKDTPPKFTFDQRFCNPRDYKLLDNGKRLYKILKENTINYAKVDQFLFKSSANCAMVSPFLFKSSKIRFIIQRICNFDVGIARKVQLSLKSKAYIQFYSISNKGKVSNNLDSSQNQQYFSFNSQQCDDIIEVEYSSEFQQLKVTNLTNQSSHTLKKINDQPGNLYFAVNIHQQWSIIQITE